jgi:osmotically-inducible protein OsmY
MTPQEIFFAGARAAPRWLLAMSVCAALGGCVAVAGGAMVGGSMMAVDRRSTGAQIDDQNIDLNAPSTIAPVVGDRAHVTATSYNQVVLITGEVPTEADKAGVAKALASIPNVRAVVNELAVMPNASMGTPSNDTIITGKVKAAFLDAPDLQFASIKVITERGNVYLMGRLTDTESKRAGDVARAVGGVKKVNKVFESITPAELAALPVPPDTPASAPKAAASAPAK